MRDVFKLIKLWVYILTYVHGMLMCVLNELKHLVVSGFIIEIGNFELRLIELIFF